jgi:hypothetical protein
MKDAESNCGYELSLNNLSGANPVGASGLNNQTKDNSFHTNGRSNDNSDRTNGRIFESSRASGMAKRSFF